MKKIEIKDMIFIQIIFLWYSCVGIFSKNAAKYDFFSFNYLKWYAGVIVVMGVYALLWQQALKKFPLNIAYACRSIVTVWSVLWGILFLNEHLTVGKVLGTVIIVIGIIMVVSGEKNENSNS